MTWQLRLATADDAASIADIYRPIVESTATSFEIDPPGPQEMAKRIESTLQDYPWLVVEGLHGVAGYAYAGAHRARAAYRWSVETSAYVGEKFRRQGIGRGLYVSLVRILTAQGYANAYAGITLPNAGSVGLHEAVGFQAIGTYRNVGYKLGAWHDVGWWHLPLGAPPAVPTSPVSMEGVQRDPSWPAMLESGLSCLRDAR